MGHDYKARYRNPVELGWAGMIKFDHEFVGRDALEKEVANPQGKDGYPPLEQRGYFRRLQIAI